MFKTILKIAVLSATAMTLLSACGAAKKALNSAADDALNAALAKAEKRYLGNIKEIIDENGNTIQVYTDDNGNHFQANLDEFGNPFQVKDDNGNPIPVTINDNGNSILTVATGPTTAEICSGKDVWELSESPCDNDEASIQRRHESCVTDPRGPCLHGDDRYKDAQHEHCLKNPFNYYCREDDRYHDARFEKCAIDFFSLCEEDGFAKGGSEVYFLRIKFCNNPVNADHLFCFVSSEAGADSAYYNQFLQGTEDGLNTGSLRASISDATAPVVHTLKLPYSDDGVAFFAGTRPDAELDFYYNNYYAGILPDPDLGAPITQTDGTAVWQGTFSIIASVTHNSDPFRTDADFDLEIDFNVNRLSASINDVKNKDQNDYLNDRTWTHSDYRLSGVFSDGKIEGELHRTIFLDNRSIWGANKLKDIKSARVRGLIGQDGAVGVFVGGWYSFSGGFVARPPSE